MKILFVEDELSKNIPRIIRLFGNFLGKKRIQRLQDLEADSSGYGAEPEEIKEIVEETNFIEVDYRFPEALPKILYQYDHYLLFIIDRNLVEGEYTFEEVHQIDSSFTEEQYEKFYEREGDYFLYKLAFNGVDLKNKFFFLTAYDVNSGIRGIEEIEEFISHFGDFKARNVIEKGSGAFDILLDVMANIKTLSIRSENSHYLNILHKYADQICADSFLDILMEKDNERRIKDNLSRIRNIHEAILKACCRNIPEMAMKCTNERGEVILGDRTIKWLSDTDHINSIIRQFLFTVKTISSDYGSHENTTAKRIYAPTTDTVNALVHALKDLICWFGSISSQNKNG